MKSPFPTPALPYLLKEFQPNAEAVSLAGALDRAFAGMYSDALGLRDRYTPESCPTQLLDELYASIGGTPKVTDTDAQKRAKITTAIEQQKYNGTWVFSAKLAIDAITGASSVIWGSPQSDWPVQIGDASAYNNGFHWMIQGGSGLIGDESIIMIGAGTESIIAGNVYIDVGISTLTANQVALVVAALQDIVPAYFRIFLGWTVSGVFTAYVGGQLG
jgi:hypothetical protein